MSEMVFVGGRVLVGDCRVVLADVPDGSVDSCVTDPPYDLTNRTPDVKGCEDCGRTLGGRDGNPEVCPKCGGVLSRQRSVQGKGGGGFMGHGWDSTGVAFDVETWTEVLRVLKPGAHLVAFGATRSYHRMVVAIEDAGFEIRDTIMAWGYGTGFPKSHNISKAIDKAAGAEREVVGPKVYGDGHTFGERQFANRSAGIMGTPTARPASVETAPATEDAARWEGWGTALKPAIEPIVLARKPLNGTVAANVLTYGTGALNIDATRIAPTEAGARPAREGDYKQSANGAVYAGRQASGTGFDGGSKAVGETTQGRFPSNLVLVHHPDCRPTETVEAWECVGGCPVADIDQQSGERPGCKVPSSAVGPESIFRPGQGGYQTQGPIYPDTGGASRFFARFGWAIDEHIEQAGSVRYVAKAPGRERPSYEVLDPPTTMLRLRDDLTDEQRAHVLERLQEAGVDVG